MWLSLAWLLPISFSCCLLPCAAQDGTEASEPAESTLPASILNSDGMLNLDYRLEILGPDGKPVLVNVTLEEVRKLKSQAASSAQLPDANFKAISVDAVVTGKLADVEGNFEVELGATGNPARIGLRFDSCILTEEPSWTNDSVQGRVKVIEGGGYEWLLRGSENESVVLTLRGKSVIQQKSDRHTLTINLPAALATVDVLLPKNAVEVRARPDDIVETTLADDGVQATVHTRGGAFTLSWREQGAVKRISSIEAESNTVFDIIDPHEPWRATTDLNVRWYGSDSSNEFEIQLPPRAQWRSYPNPVEFERFRISAVEPTAEEAANPTDMQSQRLLVQMLDASQTDSVKLILEWDWLPAKVAEGEPTDETEARLPLPIVGGVDAHTGTINCNFPASYAAVFKEGPGAKLIQQGRLAGVFGQQQMQRQMQFRFDQQDFELTMTFRQEQSLPTVRPTYKVNIDQNKLVLTAWLNCSFDANGQPLEIGLLAGDWIIEENTAQVLKNADSPFDINSELLSVKRTIDGSYIFNGGETDTGLGNTRRIEQVWRIVAERSWNPDDNNVLQFQIPQIIRFQPNGATEIDHASGVLLVSSADNVLPVWNETASTGLLPDSFSNEYRSYLANETIREPLAYRFQGRGTTPGWAGVAQFLPQQVSFDQDCTLDVLSNEIQVRQAFMLRVANDPLTNLQVAIREDTDLAPQAYVNDNLTVLQLVDTISFAEMKTRRDQVAVISSAAGAREPAAVTPSSNSNAKDSELQWKVYRLVGAPDVIGSATVSILTKLPFAIPAESNANANVSSNAIVSSVATTSETDDAVRDTAIKLNVPVAQLLLPAGTQSVRQDWRIRSEVDFEVSARTSTGQQTGTNRSSAKLNAKLDSPLQNEQQLTLPIRTVELLLELRKREVGVMAQIAIEDSMLQSVLAGDKRRDRYAARVKTSSGRITMRLPRMVGEPERVAVDGRELQQSDAPYDYNSKTLSITLPASPIEQERVVEIFYLIDDSLSWITPIHAEVPQIDGADYRGRFFWQLVTPSDKHLGWCPTGLTAEWNWQWSGLWWYRSCEQDQASLERWLGSSVQSRQPLSTNSYVMSGQGDIAPQDVWVLSRLILWLPMGLVAIAFSISALTFSFLRSPVTAFVLAVAILTLSMIWPDLAVLLGQTAVLSLSLVALVWVTQAAIDTRVRRRSVFTTRPSTYLDGSEQASAGRSQRIAAPVMVGSSIAQAGEK